MVAAGTYSWVAVLEEGAIVVERSGEVANQVRRREGNLPEDPADDGDAWSRIQRSYVISYASHPTGSHASSMS
jgi:hypothetical protein